MGLHFIPLLVGAAAGAVATYFYKDEPTREKIKAGAAKVGESVKRGLGKAKPEVAREQGEAAGELPAQ